ncbi:hypothetical protein [Comamonas sp. JC664]|uniref:hypothetical protein n=1 Tax=Comamonas sp. JC664 TaxID=2801917 RepID=UPI003612A5EE
MPRGCLVVTVRDPALGLVRVMCTHLEYHSASQRLAQVQALRAIHAQALAQLQALPAAASAATPYTTPVHTPHAVLCGDFNLHAGEAPMPRSWPCRTMARALWHDSWPLLHGSAPQPATFCVFDRSWGPTRRWPCDFALVSDSLRSHVRAWHSDSTTQLSDHQPVLITLT